VCYLNPGVVSCLPVPNSCKATSVLALAEQTTWALIVFEHFNSSLEECKCVGGRDDGGMHACMREHDNK
jgi:hypothetical protein